MAKIKKGAVKATPAGTSKNNNDVARQEYIDSTAGKKLLAELITWAPRQGTPQRTHKEISAALSDAGLDSKLARELPKKSAFSRACKKLSEARVIRELDEDDDEVRFQFTKETKSGDTYQYDLETVLTLDKTTGIITCPSKDLKDLQEAAQKELDRCIEYRLTSDVTAIVHRAFDAYGQEWSASLAGSGSKGGAIFNLPDARGVYVVPIEHQPFLEKCFLFLDRLGWRMNRVPMAAGSGTGERTMRETVAEGMARIVREFEEAVASFGVDTKESTLERAAERIKVARFKVEAYSAYLGEERAKLEAALEEARCQLRARMAAITKAKDADFTADCEHCGCPNVLKGGETEFVCCSCKKMNEVEWEAEAACA
jgi:hypothetical protein